MRSSWLFLDIDPATRGSNRAGSAKQRVSFFRADSRVGGMRLHGPLQGAIRVAPALANVRPKKNMRVIHARHPDGGVQAGDLRALREMPVASAG